MNFIQFGCICFIGLTAKMNSVESWECAEIAQARTVIAQQKRVINAIIASGRGCFSTLTDGVNGYNFSDGRTGTRMKKRITEAERKRRHQLMDEILTQPWGKQALYVMFVKTVEEWERELKENPKEGTMRREIEM
jgi:hypothetical protein